jgi:hypothetical protein
MLSSDGLYPLFITPSSKKKGRPAALDKPALALFIFAESGGREVAEPCLTHAEESF